MNKLTFIPGIEINQIIGREVQLNQLTNIISEKRQKITVITGIGGIGKTSVALSFINDPERISCFSNIGWVNCSKNSIKEDFINAFFDYENIFKHDLKKSIDENFDNIILGLQKVPERNLLVIDNIDDNDALEEIHQDLLNTGFDIIITSRSVPEDFQILPLKNLDKEDALDLFFTHYKKGDDRKTADEILSLIDYHSLLTILLAKVTQNNDNSSLKKLKNTLSKKPFDANILNKWNNKISNYSKKNNREEKNLKEYISKLFSTSNLNESEIDTLKKLCILPAGKNYSFDFITDLLYIKKENTSDFNQQLNRLVAKGWLNKLHIEGEANYNIHQLIQIALQINLKPGIEDLHLTMWRLGLKLAFADKKANHLEEKLLWSEISEAFIDYLEIPETNANEDHLDNICLLYNNLALCYQDLSNFQKALKHQLTALNLKKRYIKKPNLSLAKHYNNLSTIYKDLGDYEKSMENQLKTIRIKEEILDINDPSLARSYNNLSLLYNRKNEFNKALELQLKAIKIRETFKKSPNIELANSYHNISTIYSNFDNLNMAMEFQEKAIQIYQQVYLTPHPVMATALNNLAHLYKKMDNNDKAEEIQLLVLDIRKVCLSANHRDLESSHTSLAMLYREKAKFSKALQHIENSVRILQNIFPNGHPDLDNARNIKNEILRNIGQAN